MRRGSAGQPSVLEMRSDGRRRIVQAGIHGLGKGETMELERVSDYYKMAILDLHGISPQKIERSGSRICGLFPKDAVSRILQDYESGVLRVVARDFEAALRRTRTRIIEAKR